MTARVIAYAAVSAQGRGASAVSVGDAGDAPPSRIARDAALERAGLTRPYCARAALPPSKDRGRAVLELVAQDLAADLEAHAVAGRLAVVVGTSSGGMQSLEHAVAGRAVDARAVPYFGPLAALERFHAATRIQVLAACASSTLAIGIALRLLQQGAADLAIAGGYDAVSDFVAAGFEALGATSAEVRSFRLQREGLALGEGAALLALARPEAFPDAPTLGYVTGFGASSDARHVTAPDPDGLGLARAAERALANAGHPPIHVVSAHATGTPHNDGAEARAISRVVSSDAVVHPFKAVVGHCLGAAGALESLAALDALERGVLPAAAGEGSVIPELCARLLSRVERGNPEHALKLSSAFGGANAALVLSNSRGPEPSTPRQVYASPALSVSSPEVDPKLVRIPPERLSRLDALSAWVLAAAVRARPLLSHLDLGGVGVVVATAAATLTIDEDFETRRTRRRAEPRRFPPTSPNVCAGTAAIGLGLGGPSLSVGAGPEPLGEALMVARALIAAGDAGAMIVIAAEDVGDFVRELWRSAGFAPLANGAVVAVLGADPALGRALPADPTELFRGLK